VNPFKFLVVLAFQQDLYDTVFICRIHVYITEGLSCVNIRINNNETIWKISYSYHFSIKVKIIYNSSYFKKNNCIFTLSIEYIDNEYNYLKFSHIGPNSYLLTVRKFQYDCFGIFWVIKKIWAEGKKNQVQSRPRFSRNSCSKYTWCCIGLRISMLVGTHPTPVVVFVDANNIEIEKADLGISIKQHRRQRN